MLRAGCGNVVGMLSSPTNATARRRRLGAVLVAIGLAATVPAVVSSPVAVAATQAKPGFPSVTVTDIATGKGFNLASLATTKTPILYWMWAPT